MQYVTIKLVDFIWNEKSGTYIYSWRIASNNTQKVQYCYIYIKVRTCYDSKSVKNKFLGGTEKNVTANLLFDFLAHPVVSNQCVLVQNLPLWKLFTTDHFYINPYNLRARSNYRFVNLIFFNFGIIFQLFDICFWFVATLSPREHTCYCQ